jgi:hypothetical protein
LYAAHAATADLPVDARRAGTAYPTIIESRAAEYT